MIDEYDDDELFNNNEQFSEEQMNTTYSITDMTRFCDETRKLVASNIKGDLKLTSKELDSFITLVQVEKIVRKYALPEDKNDGKVCLNLDRYEKIFDDVSIQIYGTALAKLAAEGFLESAWDDKLNDMVFWVNDMYKKDSSK